MAERVKLSVEEYLAELLELVQPLTGVDQVVLDEAAGRVLAEPLVSPVAVPSFDNSAMDGFALRHAEVALGQIMPEVAQVPAGSSLDPEFGPGECVRIMTGAPVPTAADTIIARELVTETGAGILINEVPAPGAHIRAAGGDFEAGATVLPASVVLGPHHLSLAASCGFGQVPVRTRPRVAIASTGDELLGPGQPLARGQIHESNHIGLVTAARAQGAQVIARAVLPDDPVAFTDGLERLSERADLVVLSGGVSAGDHDVVREVLSDQAQGVFRHVGMQPGKPQGWARWTHISGRVVPVVGLPGNPLSTAISFELFIRPLLRAMLGIAEPAWSVAIAAQDWPSPAGRRQFIPVRVEHDDRGRRLVRPAHHKGSASHMVSALAGADGLAQVDAQTTVVRAGDPVVMRSMN